MQRSKAACSLHPHCNAPAALRWNFLCSCRDRRFPEKPELHTNGATLRAYEQHRQALQQVQNASPRSLSEQVVPLAGFLGGKFTSHVLLGAGLGAFGAAMQPSFQARAVMQLIAGGFLLLLAANLLGAPGLSWLVPAPDRKSVV